MAQQSLQKFVDEIGSGSHLRVEHDYGDGFVRLKISEAERRQAAQDIQCSENIVLELLRNSRDAHASNIFVAFFKEGTKRFFTVIDDGDGIPKAMHELVFEPRVTSKLETSHMDAWGLHGRGMALYSIAQNSLESGVANSEKDMGCAIYVKTDTTVLPEKKDQSSFPRFELAEEDTVNVRGPKNILRTLCEFAVESRSTCAVYAGSPAEIAADLYAFGSSTLSEIDRVFCRNEQSIPLVKRLAVASDANDFTRIASAMGINLSSRTARRIMEGQVVGAGPLLSQISIVSQHDTGTRNARRKNVRKTSVVKLQNEESAAIALSAKAAFAEIAERYYLEPDVDPRVRTTSDSLTITIPIVEKYR